MILRVRRFLFFRAEAAALGEVGVGRNYEIMSGFEKKWEEVELASSRRSTGAVEEILNRSVQIQGL
jgi:hypothetical protein